MLYTWKHQQECEELIVVALLFVSVCPAVKAGHVVGRACPVTRLNSWSQMILNRTSWYRYRTWAGWASGMKRVHQNYMILLIWESWVRFWTSSPCPKLDQRRKTPPPLTITTSLDMMLIWTSWGPGPSQPWRPQGQVGSSRTGRASPRVTRFMGAWWWRWWWCRRVRGVRSIPGGRALTQQSALWCPHLSMWRK